MNKSKKTRQQIKDEQINYLLGDVEKTLEDYRQNIELKEKQLSDAKKILLSAKQSHDKIVAENNELKAYIENLKQGFIGLQQQQQQQQQQQKVQFLEKQRNCYQQKKPTSKKYKKVVYEEESESEPEPEQEEGEESENKAEAELKKATPKRKTTIENNIFNYINKNAKRHKQQKYSG